MAAGPDQPPARFSPRDEGEWAGTSSSGQIMSIKHEQGLPHPPAVIHETRPSGEAPGHRPGTPPGVDSLGIR